MLFYDRAQVRERNARADRILDVNQGTNGGKEATALIKELRG